MEQISTESSSLTTTEFISKCRDMMIPLKGTLAYFSVVPLDEEESDRLVFDPTLAFPPRLSEIIPNIRLVIVPYLEAKPDLGLGQPEAEILISFQKPSESTRRFAEFVTWGDENYLFIAVASDDYYDAHVVLYRALATKVAKSAGAKFTEPFHDLLDAELEARAHGELHERSWRLKREFLGYKGDAAGRAAVLDAYRWQALVSTLTLYLHGLCCDLELDAAPKQLASRYIRKRLLLLKDLLPPPKGIALFPEELPL